MGGEQIHVPLLPDKFQQFACLACQGKALGVKKAVGKGDSAVKDDSLSHVGPAKAAVDSQCPVCLGGIKKAGSMACCMGKFFIAQNPPLSGDGPRAGMFASNLWGGCHTQWEGTAIMGSR